MCLCMVGADGSGTACWMYILSTLPSKQGLAPTPCKVAAKVSDDLLEKACKLVVLLDGKLSRGAIFRVWSGAWHGTGATLGVWPLDVKGVPRVAGIKTKATTNAGPPGLLARAS